TNELGTCKHIEVVKKFLSLKKRNQSFLTESEQSKQVSIYISSRASHEKLYSSAEEIRVHIPPAIQNILLPVFKDTTGPDGYLRNEKTPIHQKNYFESELKRWRKALGKQASIDVDPRVMDVLNQEIESYQWEQQIETNARD